MGHTNDYDKASVEAPKCKWNGVSLGLSFVGVALIVAAFFIGKEKQHTLYSYLTSFMFYLSISLGALFFVLIQHLTRAGWSVTVRRIAEGYTKNFIVLAVLFLPIAFNLDAIFAWNDVPHGDHHAKATTEIVVASAEAKDAHAGHDHATDAHAAHAAHATEGDDGYIGHLERLANQKFDNEKDRVANTKWIAHLEHVLHVKHGYFAKPFFFGRIAFYFICWIGLACFFFGKSTKQDTMTDKEESAKTTIAMGKTSTVGIAIFALTTTFASFDLIMSTDYGWFSTIFGVIYFAGGFVASLAIIILTAVFLQKRGYLKGAINVEHYHDLGKLLFAFTVFWTYVSFSQLILIWYADIPEETCFYFFRWSEATGWKNLSWVVLFGHFVIPFLLLLSRHVKRSAFALPVMALWMLIMSYTHLYWEIMPNKMFPAQSPFAFQAVDVVLLLGFGLLYIGSFLFGMKKVNLIPVNDPRLKESLNFHNY